MTDAEFTDHYTKFNPILVRAMGRRFGTELCEDIAQQAWMSAFRCLSGFRGDCSFTAWVAHIAINEGLTIYRRRACRPREVELTSDIADKFASDGELVERDIIAKEEAAKRESRIINLRGVKKPHRYVDVYRMRFVFGSSVADTAKALGMNENTVKVYTMRIRLRLSAKK